MSAPAATPDTADRPWLAPAMLVATTFLWATNVLLARELAGSTTPFALSFWRWLGAAAVLLPFAAAPLRREWRTAWRRRGHLFVLGVLSVGVFHTGLYLAAHFSTAITIALINGTVPIAIAGADRLLHGGLVEPRVMAALALCLLGAVTVITRGDPAALLGLDLSPGDAILVLGVVVWAVYTVRLQRGTGLHWAGFQWLLIIAGLVPVALGYAVEAAVWGSRLPLDAATFLKLAYLVVFPTLVATVLWNAAVPRIGATRAGLFNHLVPVFVSLLAVTLLGERLDLHHAVGFAAIFAGFLTLKRRSPVTRVEATK